MPTADTRSVAALGQRISDAVAARDADELGRLSRDDLVLDVVVDGIRNGKEASTAFMEELFTATPDMTYTIDRMLIIDDQRIAIVQWTYTGTFTGGAFLGLEPTGRKLDTRGISVMEFDDEGLLIHNTIYWDHLAFARRAGILPAEGSLGDKAITGGFNTFTKLRKVVARSIKTSKNNSGETT